MLLSLGRSDHLRRIFVLLQRSSQHSSTSAQIRTHHERIAVAAADRRGRLQIPRRSAARISARDPTARLAHGEGKESGKGASCLLAALLFQVGVGFRKIRHFYFVINSVSFPANSDLQKTRGCFTVIYNNLRHFN